MIDNSLVEGVPVAEFNSFPICHECNKPIDDFCLACSTQHLFWHKDCFVQTSKENKEHHIRYSDFDEWGQHEDRFFQVMIKENKKNAN